MLDFQTIVLAAGKGTRMKSKTVKILHEVAGKPILWHVMRASLDAGATRVIVVVGHQREEVEAYLAQEFAGKYAIAVQEEQKGTGHAVFCAAEYLKSGPSRTMIVSGDVPNMNADTLRSFFTAAQEFEFAVMTAVLDDAGSYGRIVRNTANEVTGIVEFKDADSAQRAIREINAGFYVARTSFLLNALTELCSGQPHNAQGEYYLTDLVAMAAANAPPLGWKVLELSRIHGVNTRLDLALCEQTAQIHLRNHWMTEGVTMLDPATVYLDAEVLLESDVVLHPNVQLRGKTRIGTGSIIETGAVLTNMRIGEDIHIKPHTVAQDSSVGAASVLGPFAHLRPKSTIGAKCKVGNFVETKNVNFAEGVKASHLSYLGDANIDEHANIGAGTITCNYDGKNKHTTTIGKYVFIGSNSALVAPITIGDQAYVGAGSVITRDVEPGALGVARGKQQNIDGWARRRRG
jgi:bifunctional UDP-N-acetylglucosamine pyrophosphorylase/glucosamine-1-phosphate N-acetyltransferase